MGKKIKITEKKIEIAEKKIDKMGKKIEIAEKKIEKSSGSIAKSVKSIEKTSGSIENLIQSNAPLFSITLSLKEKRFRKIKWYLSLMLINLFRFAALKINN